MGFGDALADGGVLFDGRKISFQEWDKQHQHLGWIVAAAMGRYAKRSGALTLQLELHGDPAYEGYQRREVGLCFNRKG